MHIVLVSQCEKKAILRTAKVLDAYGVRHGDRTWVTPITKNGLDALYHELRSRGTRQTAVACYVNDGTRRLKLLWVIGRKGAFGPAGAVAVATKQQPARKQTMALSPAVRLACLLAECAGLIHDFGKYGLIFQKKLESPTPLADPIRHEWISLQVLLALLDGKSWEEGWNQSKPLRMSLYSTHAHGIGGGLKTVEAVLAFLVMSHHRLPRGMKAGQRSTIRTSVPSDDEYIREDALTADETTAAKNPFQGQPSTLAMKRFEHLLARIRAFELPERGPEALRAIATLARMSLILADHHVSSIDKTQDNQYGGNGDHGSQIAGQLGVVFANTHKHHGLRLKNQELSWHLANVGEEAGAMVQRMLTFQPPGLTGDAVDAIRQPSSGRFLWQNICAEALETAQSSELLPTLVINIAGTGTGKTRMNMRAVAALRAPDSQGYQEPIRVATALNLRTLTLQTRDAYANQLGLNQQQLACVLGSQIAVRLHDAGKRILDDDENDPEEDYLFEGIAAEPPAWLTGFLEKKPVLKPLIMAPVVVSTIDFLINAGEPHRQGNHGLAMLRMMHSDLILDEIDAYDPKAMVAVSRLVTASAMWGRHVIASSATLSIPVATVLFKAFALGMQLRCALDGNSPKWRQVVIDDRIVPTVTVCDTVDDFKKSFEAHNLEMMNSLGVQRYRPAELLAVNRFGGLAQGADHFFNAVKTGCEQLHQRHAWTAPQNSTGFKGKISIGLIRMANVRPAISMARRLANEIPNVRVCCYHSQVGLFQRWNIEKNLDDILTRKEKAWPMQVVKNSSVIEAMQRSYAEGADSLSIIVVATPVEEIGRDHDFDWAVIEPSSSQSIVQTAGRVNRHRLVDVQTPNIAVLQFNYRACTQPAGKAVFSRPGLEPIEDSAYGDHNLETLLNWQALGEAGQVDARLRYQTEIHKFAKADDHSLTDAVRRHMDAFIKSDNIRWMMKDTYTGAPLRDATNHEEWFIDASGNYFKRERTGYLGRELVPYKRSPERIIAKHKNDWLVLSLEDTQELACEFSPVIPLEQATTVQILSFGENNETVVHHDLSFGYWSQRSRA